jgi:hypothetical protein
VRTQVRALVTVAMVAWAAVAHAQGNPDEQALKAAHETLVGSVTTGNLTMAQAMIHPRGMGFFKDSQMLVQLSSQVGPANILPAVIADVGRFVSVPTDTTYGFFGQVGLVNMTATLRAKKGEKQPDRFVRGTYVYIADGGNWKLVSWHGSDIPLQKK